MVPNKNNRHPHRHHQPQSQSQSQSQPQSQSEDADIPTTISADEVALYDRQIRLWGIEAQARMRNSKILLIGMRALANEISKNLVLAGIGSITILDPDNVHEEDLCSQFFVQEEHLGMNRAEAASIALQKLNPRVNVKTDNSRIQDKDSSFFNQFDITIATDLDLDSLIAVNNACRAHGKGFYASSCYGLYGYIFADLIKHEFVIERDKSNITTTLTNETPTRRIVSFHTKKSADRLLEIVTKEETYSPLFQVISVPIPPSYRPRKRRTIPIVLPCLKGLWMFQRSHNGSLPMWKRDHLTEFTKYATEAMYQLGLPIDMLKASFISSFVENATSELAPVAAILGGILAQDVINVLGKREQPLQNFLVFDGDTQVAPILALHPVQEDENGSDLTGGIGMKDANGASSFVTAEAISID